MRRIITSAFLVFVASLSPLFAQLSLASGTVSGTPTPTLDFANRLVTLPGEGGSFTIAVTASPGTFATNTSVNRYSRSFLERTGDRRVIRGPIFVTEQDFTYPSNPSRTESRETTIWFFLSPASNPQSFNETLFRVVQAPGPPSGVENLRVSGTPPPVFARRDGIIRLSYFGGQLTLTGDYKTGITSASASHNAPTGIISSPTTTNAVGGFSTTFTYTKNTGAERGPYTLTIASTTSTPPNGEDILQIVQDGTPSISVVPLPDDLDLTQLPAVAGALLLDVKVFPLGNIVPITVRVNAAVVNAPAGYLTLVPNTAGTFHAVQYTANETGFPRIGVVRFTSTLRDGTILSEDVTLTQLAVGLSLSTDAELRLPLSSATGSFDITYIRTGSATSVSIDITEGASFLTASGSPTQSPTHTKAATETFTLTANSTGAVRQATIQFIATDGTNDFTKEITLTQSDAGEAHTLSVDTDVDVSGNLSPEGEEITFTVNVGGGATGWTAKRTTTSSHQL